MSLPEGPDVILVAKVKQGDTILAGGAKAVLLGVEGNIVTKVLIDGQPVGGLYSLDHFIDITLLHPGNPDGDRLTVLNGLLEDRTPYAAGQEVTVNLARDILTLLDTFHIPAPPTGPDQVTKVVDALYAKRGLLEGVATDLSAFMVGPWEFNQNGPAIKTWTRHVIRPNEWKDFICLVHEFTRIDNGKVTDIERSWQLIWQAGEEGSHERREMGQWGDAEEMKAKLDHKLRRDGFILLSR